jgi:pimeloyl-ACP methyl ester carboxylesterase
MNLYFISGLGADKRVFQKLILPEVFTIHYIEWLPVAKKESLEFYCRRLSEQIDRTQPFSLLGLSFGGVIATEMSKFLSPVQTVLISSFCLKQEVSKFYVLLGETGLYKLLPTRIFLKPNHFVYRMFGAYKPAAKQLLQNILEDTDPEFFHWALNQLFSWNNHWIPPNLIRIHGTADKVLPYKTNMGAIPVEGGEHLMVYSKWEIVSEILKEKLLPE